MDFGYFLRRLDQGCHVDPGKEAVVFKDERISHRELRDRSYRVANALASLGVNKGDRVGVLLRNCCEWFDIFFAVASLGAVMVPVNFLLKSKEVEFLVRDSGMKVLFVGEDLLPLVDPGSKATPDRVHVICIGQAEPPPPVLSYADLARKEKADPPDRQPPQADDLFLLQYTSGTTGFPKGAMHTQGTILWNSFHQIGDFTITDNERYLCIPGLCWAAGLHDFTLGTLWMGGTVVVMPSGGLEIASLLSIIQEEKITKVLLVPAILKQVVDDPDLKNFDLSTLEFVASGAAPVPVTVIEQFNELLPESTLIQGYGLSEGPTIAICLKKRDAIRKIGSVGKPVTNCEAMVVDESLNRVSPGTKGEIIIRSPATMKGYWNRPEATREVFADGWMRTGDMAEYDDEGYIYVTGRKKDMYISGGLNVYPAEIENVILRSAGVAETAVIGITDPKWGEVGCAIIVPKDGEKISLPEIEARCKEELANYKVPRKYMIRTEPLPRTASGKVKKFELQEACKSEARPARQTDAILEMRRKKISRGTAAYAPDAHLQWWYFDAAFDDGHRLLTYFLPGFKGRIADHGLDQPYLNIVLKRPDGGIIREPRSFPPSEFLPRRGDFGARFGEDCSTAFEKGSDEDDLGRYTLKAGAGRLGYELVLTPDIPPWSPFGPPARIPRWIMMLARRSIATRDFIYYAPFVPRGRMEGQIALDGKAFDVRGTGYHEHGSLSFPLHEFTEAWYWLHIEHPPWTILTGTSVPPSGLLKPRKETRGGFAFVQKGGKRLLATADLTGLLVNWQRLDKRTPLPGGETNMAWNAEVRLARPGLRVRARVRSSEVLEYMPFSYHEKTPRTPYWGQSVARAEVDILHGGKRVEFDAECVLETMVSGGTGKLGAHPVKPDP